MDSHCHLADDAFSADLAAVVARAKVAGLAGALCILDASENRELDGATALATLWAELRFAAGVHPHHAARYAESPEQAADAARAAIAGNPRVRAIGEIGLDYHYDFAPHDVQQEVFRAQLILARELALPVVIHTRDADEDTFAILRDEAAGRVSGVFHCFTGDYARATRALDLGFQVSLAGIVTFPRATDVQDVARRVPDDRYLVETDAPYLAPVPYRGKRNEPAWVARVVDAVAGLRGRPPAAVAAAAARTFDALFRP